MDRVREGRAVLAAVLLSGVSLLLAPGAHGQTQAAAGDGVSGRWIGSLDTVHADGSVERGGTAFDLQQKGAQVLGGAGDRASHLSEVREGKVLDGEVVLPVAVRTGVLVEFRLRREGTHLRGTATGLPGEAGSRVVVDAVPADASWHATEPVAHVPDRLAETVARLDRELFTAYNGCDLKRLGELVAEDLEFYHDKTGLVVGRAVFLRAIEQNICGKTQRELVGELEVGRLATYGALETGRHRFTHPGHPEVDEGEAKFLMLWRLKDGQWQLTRVVSYDHVATAR